ncbi:CaiB/BaiF CoA transferase family protein [Thermodesulfobacteriota bacterium]
MKKQVFEGLKAVGFVQAGVGPFTLRVLANHGATVVRVESIKHIDNLRVTAPFRDNKPGINRSGYFNFPNSDKYSLALDMTHKRSAEIIKKLVTWADIIVENFSPGAMARRGLSYDDVKKINPGIIMISMSQQGQTGPHKLMAGYGSLLQGIAGFTQLTGWPDRTPALIDRSYPDMIAPRFGAIGLIAALDYKNRTGKGQYIDLSQYEGAVHFLAPTILDYSANNRIQVRAGNKHPSAVPHGAYRCKGDDRWCVIAVFTDSEWEVLCGVIGNPEWTKSELYSTFRSRKQNEEKLNELIEKWTIDHEAEEVMGLLQDVGVMAGVVQTVDDLVERDPQLKHRRYFQRLEHPEMGETLYVRPNYVLSKTPAEIKMPAPCFGEHNEHVCREFLGLSEKEYDELLVDNVFT